MAKPDQDTNQTRKRRRATTPEARENQMVALAMDLVEKRLLEGTASSQETTHFLKIGSTKETYEKEKLIEENKLLRAKTEALQSQKKIEELYKKAMMAMRTYSGSDDEDDYDD
jgi:hypothetical protein